MQKEIIPISFLSFIIAFHRHSITCPSKYKLTELAFDEGWRIMLSINACFMLRLCVTLVGGSYWMRLGLVVQLMMVGFVFALSRGLVYAGRKAKGVAIVHIGTIVSSSCYAAEIRLISNQNWRILYPVPPCTYDYIYTFMLLNRYSYSSTTSELPLLQKFC